MNNNNNHFMATIHANLYLPTPPVNQLRLEISVGVKLHALADGNYCIQIREKMPLFSSMVLPMSFPYH